jgi:hypothetical protein
MKSKVVLTSLLLLLVFTAFSFKCDGGPVPDNSPYRGAAKAADDIAAAIHTMIQIKRTLAQNGTLKPAEERPLNDALLKLTRADKAFVKEINAVKSTTDATTSKPKICAALALVNTALAEVNSDISPVASADAKSKLAAALTTITNLLPAITTVVAC